MNTAKPNRMFWHLNNYSSIINRVVKNRLKISFYKLLLSSDKQYIGIAFTWDGKDFNSLCSENFCSFSSVSTTLRSSTPSPGEMCSAKLPYKMHLTKKWPYVNKLSPKGLHTALQLIQNILKFVSGKLTAFQITATRDTWYHSFRKKQSRCICVDIDIYMVYIFFHCWVTDQRSWLRFLLFHSVTSMGRN